MKRLFALLLVLTLLLCGCTTAPTQQNPPANQGCAHADANGDVLCDNCGIRLEVSFEIYCINDMHGKVTDSKDQPGVDELTTYIKSRREVNPNVILLSAGDMWQGSAESNLTKGQLTTEWMNDIGFDAMTLGNHEYDWGESFIQTNAELAQFPFLAINIYDRETDTRVSYCDSSVMVDQGNVQIGIIGAMGDCYSSIAADKTTGIYFKTGDELTQLVKDEATKLREQGADFVIYSIHDGYEDSTSNSVTYVKNYDLEGYFDASLSDGYVDLVFEGHTHQRYLLQDENGVYHMQNGGDNKRGISYVKVNFNLLDGTSNVEQPQLMSNGNYASLESDPIVEQLMEKYADQVNRANQLLGKNARQRSSKELQQLCADLYYDIGMEVWGEEYDIVLGGGFISVRSPYNLAAGDVTYGMLQTLLPFDNVLQLCSISGRELKEKFFETDNDRYFIAYGKYGEEVRQNIDPNKTYYVIVDSYTSSYKPNKLTVVDSYYDDVFARDMVADYIASGAYED